MTDLPATIAAVAVSLVSAVAFADINAHAVAGIPITIGRVGITGGPKTIGRVAVGRICVPIGRVTIAIRWVGINVAGVVVISIVVAVAAASDRRTCDCPCSSSDHLGHSAA